MTLYPLLEPVASVIGTDSDFHPLNIGKAPRFVKKTAPQLGSNLEITLNPVLHSSGRIKTDVMSGSRFSKKYQCNILDYNDLGRTDTALALGIES